MFLRRLPLAISSSYQSRGPVEESRLTCTGGRHFARTRARFRLERLEDRCLLSGISTITEFPVPSVSINPGTIVAGPDGNIWFTETASDAIAMISPNTHAISSFTIPTAGADPTGITVGSNGNLWFTELGADKVGEINPSTHAITEFALPTANAGPLAITAGSDGNLWFTEIRTWDIGEINPTTHAISQFPLAPSHYAGPYGITAGPDGNIWFAWQGTNEVGKINPETHAITYFSVADVEDAPEGITAGPDGNVWFTEEGSDQIGSINPTTDAIQSFPTLVNNTYPWGITAGPDGNLWFTDSGRIGQINPVTDVITEFPVPYTSAGLSAITAGPDGNLWFTDSGTNSIGVATLTSSQLVVTAQPPLSITAGSVFGLTVDAENGSGGLLTSFDGTVTVALANSPSGAALGGTLTATASNGVATFSNLSLTAAVTGYTLEVSASGLGAGISSAIAVTPAAASQVVVTTEPSTSVTAGSGFGLQASIEDAYGNVETSASNTVSVALAANPIGASLGGTLSVAAVDGVATFSGLTLTKAALGYTLDVSSSGLSSATSSAITVTPAAATQLVITEQPPGSVAVSTGFGLIAAIEDAYGNVETSFSGTVKVALDNNPGGAKLGGTLSVKASSGVATFSGLTLNKQGTGYTLELTSSGLTIAVTSPITVTAASPSVALSPASASAAADALLAPLVLDSVDLPGAAGLKKRLRST
jgi:streptogramin lyase